MEFVLCNSVFEYLPRIFRGLLWDSHCLRSESDKSLPGRRISTPRWRNELLRTPGTRGEIVSFEFPRVHLQTTKWRMLPGIVSTLDQLLLGVLGLEGMEQLHQVHLPVLFQVRS